MDSPTKPAWLKDQKKSEDFEIIKCTPYHPRKDFVMDKGCYTLIRVNFEERVIECAICDYDNKIQKVYQGRCAQDIYRVIHMHDHVFDKKWFTRPDHVAYLGKELKAAELALAMGNKGYYQE